MDKFRFAAILALAILVPACSLMPPKSEQLRARQMEDAVLPMAATALQAGQLETARRLYQRLLGIDPESVQARMGLGDIAMREQETEAAARWYLSALTRAEQPERRHAALLAHGRAALAAGQLEAARDSFTQLADPKENASRANVAWGHNGIGLTLLLEGDVQGGVTAMEQAVLRAPEEERFRGNLDRALAILRDLPAATAPAEEPTLGSVQEDDWAEPVIEETAVISEVEPTEPEPAEPEPMQPEPVAAEPMEVEPVEAEPVEAEPVEAEPMEAESVEAEPVEAEPLEIESIEIEFVEAEPVEAEPLEVEPVEIEPEETEPVEAESIEVAAPEFLYEPTDVHVVTEDGADYVQFGAFADPANADRLAVELSRLTSHPVQVTNRADATGARLHRVLAGPVTSEQDLVELMEVFETRSDLPADRPPSPVLGTLELGAENNGITMLLVQEDGERFLQAGAFSERATAETLADELRGLTERPVAISLIHRADAPALHRVRVGPLDPDDPLLELFSPDG